MSAYRKALQIDMDASRSRIDLAESLLRRNEGTVLLAQLIALRPEPHRIVCEVIDDSVDSRRSPEEYEQLVAAAREFLTGSPLGHAVAKRTLEWVVVADTGTGTVELWHAS
jgi:hypothetical protein